MPKVLVKRSGESLVSVKDRVGSENAVRVLTSAASAPAKLTQLDDVDSTTKNDGALVVYDAPSNKFVMTDTIDGPIKITDTTPSISPSTGALVVSGGMGVGGNLHVAGIATFGTSTIVIDGDNNIITIGEELFIGEDELRSSTLKVSGISTLGSNGGITTTGGDLFVGKGLQVAGVSTFIGQATFKGGTINLGDADSDDINVSGEFVSNLVPNATNLYDLGTSDKKWRNSFISGITSTNNLYVVGVSTFTNTLNITGILTASQGLYYDTDDFDGPNGIAYFNNAGKLVSATSNTTETVTETNLILTTNSSGVPKWSSVIDGGTF
jgi:hypothetical protein